MVGVYVYYKKRKDEIVRNNMRVEPVFSAPPDNMREEPVFPAPPDNMREEPVFPAPPDNMREEPVFPAPPYNMKEERVFPDQTLSNFAPPKYEDQGSVRAYGEENVPSYEDVMGNGVGDGGGGYDCGCDGYDGGGDGD